MNVSASILNTIIIQKAYCGLDRFAFRIYVNPKTLQVIREELNAIGDINIRIDGFLVLASDEVLPETCAFKSVIPL